MYALNLGRIAMPQKVPYYVENESRATFYVWFKRTRIYSGQITKLLWATNASVYNINEVLIIWLYYCFSTPVFP